MNDLGCNLDHALPGSPDLVFCKHFIAKGVGFMLVVCKFGPAVAFLGPSPLLGQES